MNIAIIFFQEPGFCFSIKHRCVALLYVLFKMQQQESSIMSHEFFHSRLPIHYSQVQVCDATGDATKYFSPAQKKKSFQKAEANLMEW
ncbi:MAG TPA: hypothetical protein PL045_13955 [Chitinophagaceae bacterium]|nr:hypothetical protein [Chitinophagaceae bacterium]